MDGLLIDSEPLWKEAEKAVFASIGVDLTLPMMRETVGFKVLEVVRYWHRRFLWDLDMYSVESIATRIVDRMITLISEKWEGKRWYLSTIEYARTKGLKIAINSASDYVLIDAVMKRLDIASHIDIIHSWQDEEYGKPHPGWYISTCRKLGLDPSECFVFEDSLNGILSAKSARLKCIGVPEEENHSNPKFAIADILLRSLDEFDDERFALLEQ